MKSIRSMIITATLATALLPGTTARSQLAEIPSADEIGSLIESQVVQSVELAQEHVDRALAEVDRSIQLAQAAAGAAPAAVASPQVQTRLHKIVGRGAPRSLILRSGEMDMAKEASLEEDLTVMLRVLEKAVGQRLGSEDGPEWAGIKPLFFGEGGSPRSLYLDGYGALFIMNVRFPLVAPDAKSEPSQKEEETDSAWEDAKKDLSGRREGFEFSVGNVLWSGDGREAQPYDSQKIEKLKQTLIEALKSAANIRNLKADEFITVCVMGGVNQPGPSKPVRVEKRATLRKRDSDLDDVVLAEPGGVEVRGDARRSVMTLRVKKSDVDTYAKGRLDLDDFTKKVTITAYASDSGGWSGGGFGGAAFGIAR